MLTVEPVIEQAVELPAEYVTAPVPIPVALTTCVWPKFKEYVVVVKDRVWFARFIPIVKEFVVAMAPAASVTLIVIGKLPVWLGVPVIAPLEERLKPVGSEPLSIAKLLVPVPPDALIFNVVNSVLNTPVRPLFGVVIVNELIQIAKRLTVEELGIGRFEPAA
jgi:hypothetical protein